MANERLPERSIPDRSPGHAFVPMTNLVGGTTGTCYSRTNAQDPSAERWCERA